MLCLKVGKPSTQFKPTNDNNQNEFDIKTLHKLCYVKDH